MKKKCTALRAKCAWNVAMFAARYFTKNVDWKAYARRYNTALSTHSKLSLHLLFTLFYLWATQTDVLSWRQMASKNHYLGLMCPRVKPTEINVFIAIWNTTVALRHWDQRALCTTLTPLYMNS
jgi:hypothetical protein